MTCGIGERLEINCGQNVFIVLGFTSSKFMHFQKLREILFSCSSLQFNIGYVVVTFFPGKYWSSFVLCTLPYLSIHKNKGKLKFNWE